MKFGIKLWSTNSPLFGEVKSRFINKEIDFLELSAIRQTFDSEKLYFLSGVPVVIHCDNTGVNFSQVALKKDNLAAMREAQKFADVLNAKYIVIHPGYHGTIANVNGILDEVNDSRVCVENMPGKMLDLGRDCVGRTPAELEKIHARGLCLDISHAIKSAVTLKKEPVLVIRDYLKLNPVLYHVSDGFLDSEVDEHMNIGEGNYDFRTIFELIKDKDARVVLETPKEKGGLENDIRNIKVLKRILEGIS